jgi:hypothetical protein
MWTVEKLREASVARGERSTSPVVDRALLAFERWKGRTEETYSRDQAKKDLDAILDKLDMVNLPPERRGEFPGLRELRSYARERAKEREAKLGKVVKAEADGGAGETHGTAEGTDDGAGPGSVIRCGRDPQIAPTPVCGRKRLWPVRD